MRNFTVSLLLCLSFLAAQRAEPVVVNVLFTNDLHGVFGKQDATFMNPEYPPKLSGFAGFAGYHKQIKSAAAESGEGLLTLDAGNFFQGHPIAVMDKGKSAIDMMNPFYDALVPASYDFIFGIENLQKLDGNSQIPFLGGNIEVGGKAPFKPYIIKEFSGVKVGIVGIIAQATRFSALRRNMKNTRITAEYDALKKWIPAAKADGADVVIVLTSTGVPYDREDVYDAFQDSLNAGVFDPSKPMNSMVLAHHAEGADLIVSGGVSRGYDTPWYDPTTHAAVLQNYGGGSEFGHVRLHINPETRVLERIETVDRSRVNLSLMDDEFNADPVVLSKAEAAEQKALEAVYAPTNFSRVAIANRAVTQRAKPKTDRWKIPKIGKSGELDIITWNLEFFPASAMETIDALVESISKLDVDMIALQEIRHTGWLSTLIKRLPEYDFIASQQASFMDLAIVYRKDRFKFIRQVEPFAENDYNYAGRPPLRGDFIYVDESGEELELSVINLHMKCCSSGLERRQKAVRELHGYLDEHFKAGHKNYIVLGDWNDDIKDAPNEHSFHPLFEDERFYFPTERIVDDVANSTYPHEPWVSFLDHIMVSDALLPRKADFTIQTIMMDSFVGSMEEYERLMSDHRPVHLGFKLQK